MTRQRDIIARGMDKLDLDPTAPVLDRLIDYLALLIKWNRTYNLTAIDDPSAMAVEHILDSLSVAPRLASLPGAKRIIDVGSGAGLPGVPLAICLPDREFVLLDSKSKKTGFLTQVTIELGLPHVTVVRERAEGFIGAFDVVLCRALASLPDIVKIAGHLIGDEGIILAMKGKPGGQERSAGLTGDLKILSIEEIGVPFLEAERHIVLIGHRASR